MGIFPALVNSLIHSPKYEFTWFSWWWGTLEVEKGITLIHEANQSLVAIVDASNSSVTVVNQIAVATEEQSAVADQVSQGVEQIAEITRDAEKSAQNISNAAARLNQLAGELDRMASWFKG